MVMRKKHDIMNRKGVALILVLLVMVVLSILSAAIFTLFTSNLNQEKVQTDAIRSHYIAIGGVDLALGALLQDNRSLLNDYFNKAFNISVEPLTHTVEMEGGSAEVVVTTYVESNERWILIDSTGHLDGSSVEKVIKLRFRIEYPEIQKWE
jgi:hypothetical protein